MKNGKGNSMISLTGLEIAISIIEASMNANDGRISTNEIGKKIYQTRFVTFAGDGSQQLAFLDDYFLLV